MFFYSELQREDTFKQKLTRKIQRNLPNKNFIREETNEVNQNEEQSGNEEQGDIEEQSGNEEQGDIKEQSGNEEQGHIEEQSGNEVLSPSSFLDVGCTNIQEHV